MPSSPPGARGSASSSRPATAGARIALRSWTNPPRFIAAMQLGVTASEPGHRCYRRAGVRAGSSTRARGVSRSPRLPARHLPPRRHRRARAEGVALGHAERSRWPSPCRSGVLLGLQAADLGAPTLVRPLPAAAGPRAPGRGGRRRPLRGGAEDAPLPLDRARASWRRTSRRCSTRSSTSPTRRSPT